MAFKTSLQESTMFSPKAHKKNYIALALTLALGANAHSAVTDDSSIPFKHKELYPEGIDYNHSNEAFYVSSVRKGVVSLIKKDGTSSVVINDQELVSSIGLKIDERRNRLIVCNSDPGVSAKSTDKTRGQLASVSIYDLSTGEKRQTVRLTDVLSDAKKQSSGHLANDVTVDANGNLYITDSFAPIIYKVDPEGNASVFIEDERLKTAAGTFGLNGIEYHPNGYLITAIYDSGKLFKIPLNAPKSLTEIQFKTPKAIKIDGLLLTDSNSLAVVTNSLEGPNYPNSVLKLSSFDDWKNAQVQAHFDTGTTFPTTLTEVNNELFVVYSHLHQLFSGNKQPVEDFTIQKVVFTALQP
jgi:sugar lactone lactonase YvrE